MSRTYRTNPDWRYHACGRYWTIDEERESFGSKFYSEWAYKEFINRKCRDKKPWDKPPKCFKKIRRRIEKAKVKNALVNGKEPPLFHKNDQHDWT